MAVVNENKKTQTQDPCTLSTLCTEKMANLCGLYGDDLELEIVKHLANAEQKLLFVKSIYCNGGGANQKKFWQPADRTCLRGGRLHRLFNLLSSDWILMVELLKLRGENRLHLHRVFQTIINTEGLPINTVIVNNLIHPLESPNTRFSVKVIYEMLLFATFLQDAGWWADAERLLSKMLNKIEVVYVEDNQSLLQVQYFGPHTKFLPQSLKRKKNVYSALMEIRLNLLKCIIHQPTADNFKRTEDMIEGMNFNEQLLSNLKIEDHMALKVVFHTLCASYYHSQCDYYPALKCGLQSIWNFLLLYGYHREALNASQYESMNGIRIQPTIIIDCLRNTAKALMTTGDPDNAEKLMELAINMHKIEWHGRQDIHFAILLQDYGEILRFRQKRKKSYNCFALAVQV